MSGIRPLSPRHKIPCDECDETIEDGDLKRTVKWSFWDYEHQNFDGPPREEHYCEDCWRERFAAPNAARYNVEDAETLWNLLNASEGTLVADCKPVYVGGRPYIRVVDDFVQVLHFRQTHDNVDGVVRLRSELVQTDMSREEFMTAFSPQEDGPQVRVYIRPADETPFADFTPRDASQQTLTE